MRCPQCEVPLHVPAASPDPPDCSRLVTELKHEDSSVRIAAIEELGKLKNPDTIAPLAEALSDEDSKVQHSAALALGEFRDRRAQAALKKALERSGGTLRATLARALANSGDRTAAKAVFEQSCREIERYAGSSSMMGWLDEKVAVESLGILGDPRAIKPLANLLDGGSRKRDAAEALRRIGGPEVIDPLIRAISSDSDYGLGVIVVAALRESGNPQAIVPLMRLLRDRYLKKRHVEVLQENQKDLVTQIVAAVRDLLRSCGEELSVWDLREIIWTLPDSFIMSWPIYLRDSCGEPTKERTGRSEEEQVSFYELRQVARQELKRRGVSIGLRNVIRGWFGSRRTDDRPTES